MKQITAIATERNFHGGFRGRDSRLPRKELHRINGNIQSARVRVVGMEDESQNGVMQTGAAIRLAEEMGKDLVEIVPNQDPPICRIIEYSKFKYELKKREKENKSKQHVAQLKEIRFGPQTDEHDFNFKVKHAQKFLSEGDKVKATVLFRGRSIVYKEQGEKILLEFAQALAEDGKLESMPRLDGKRMYLIIQPKGTVKKKPAGSPEPKEKGKEKDQNTENSDNTN